MVLNTQTLQVDGLDGMGWMDGLDGSLGLVEYRAPYGANKCFQHTKPSKKSNG